MQDILLVEKSFETPMTFESIYKENADRVLNLAYRMTGKEEVARDLTQDVFIKVYEKQDTFNEQAKISTWIYRIAINHIINYIKREKRLLFFNTLEKDTETAFKQESFVSYWDQNLSDQPDKVLEDSERELLVRKMIDELPSKYRIPFLLFRYEEMSYQAIANHLNISLSAVETQIHRARKKLKAKLKPWKNIFNGFNKVKIMKNKIDELLNKKSRSPLPKLEADPFLATRIAARAEEENRKLLMYGAGLKNWSFASLIAACAIILGVFIGGNIFDTQSTVSNDTMISEYSQAIYQSDLTDGWESVLDEGGSEQ